MQSQVHIDRNRSAVATLRSWLSPTGGAFADGMRLAVINGLFLIGGMIAAFLIAVVARLLRVVVDLPNISPGFLLLIMSILFGLVVWYRYARSHRRLVEASGRSLHPDRFGIVAGSPFLLLSILLLGSGFFGLVISFAGLNVGGVSAAVGRMIFAVLFGILALAVVGISRLAMRD